MSQLSVDDKLWQLYGSAREEERVCVHRLRRGQKGGKNGGGQPNGGAHTHTHTATSSPVDIEDLTS